MIKVNPGAIVFTRGKNNIRWVDKLLLSKKANSYDGSHGMIMYIGITSETSRLTPACIYYYYSTHRPLSSMHLGIKYEIE